MTDVNTGMRIIILNPSGEMNTLWLPDGEPKGRYTFEEFDIDCYYIEAREGKWYACAKNDAIFVNCPEQYHKVVEVLNQDTIVIRNNDLSYIMYSENRTDENMTLHSFSTKGLDTISIGRVEGNDIMFDNPMVSSNQATLQKINGVWNIIDNGSLNGTYLNKKKVSSSPLCVGDKIYIMSLMIVIGIDFIAMNLGGKPVYINTNKLSTLKNPDVEIEELDEREDVELFNRHPRRRKSLKFEDINVDGPPPALNDKKMPLFLTMGRSAVMGASSLLSGHFTSTLTMLLFPLLTNRYTEKEKKEYEERRKDVYTKYLNKKTKEIETEKANEEQTLRWNYPEAMSVLGFVDDGKRLWERRKIDDDFLNIRVGIGSSPIKANIDFPEDEMSIDEDDELDIALKHLVNKPRRLSDVPIQTSLVEDFICGVSGPESIRQELINNVIIQIITTHSYDEVKLVVLATEKELEQISYVRYLPHCMNDQRDFRFIATCSAEAMKISEYLKKEFDDGTDKSKVDKISEILKKRPYYVVVALDKKLFDSLEMLKDVLNVEENQGMSIISSFEDLPKECTKIFSLNTVGEHSVLYLKQLDRDSDSFVLDKYNQDIASHAIRKLSNIKLKTVAGSYTLPKSYTFLEMFNAGKIEHLNIENRWLVNNPVQSLSTPIGVATDGSVFTLDLHQKYQGPHGLVAGTTGSGKSEFLMSYILSLAVNYHPNEVAFVLIDYKGGGLAGAFDDSERGIHLPHLVGTITNLDGGAIQRSLISIQSEILRRQRVFNEAKSSSGEGTMDIYIYQRLYRNNQVSEPMPHLFIISDEFAELKQQEPEFMEKLVSAARIGRSLGIHLILATQKPAGVVDDQIRSNTKFRVCLKVQDKADSNDMLKRPDAAELKETGRFYLQIGYNEFFAMGQSGWSGADYTPQDEVIVQKDESVQIIDGVCQNIVEAKKKVEKTDSQGTQLVSIVKYISDIAKENNIKVRPLWKPAIPDKIIYGDLEEWRKNVDYDSSVKATVGIVDDPEMQEQFPLVFDFYELINLLIMGEIGSGKTVMLQTMLFDITRQYSPEKVCYYIMDFSIHSLRVFKDTPHCGAYVTEDDEDKVGKLFELIAEVADKRRKLFENNGVSTYEMYTRKNSLPLILFVIDGAGAIATMKNGDYYPILSELIKKCSGMGIQFVVTASNLGDLYTKTRQALAGRIALEQKDKFSYGDILGARCTYVPSPKVGKGLTNVNDRLLEYQCAAMNLDDGKIDDEKVRLDVVEICRKYVGEYEIDRIPEIRDDEEYVDFFKTFEKDRIPIGYALEDAKKIALPIKQFDRLSIFFGNSDSVKPVFENVIYALRENNFTIRAIKSKDESILQEVLPAEELVECNLESIQQFVLDLFQNEISYRKSLFEEKGEPKDIKIGNDITKSQREMIQYMMEKTQPLVIIFEKMEDMPAVLDSEATEVFVKIAGLAKALNMYFVAAYYGGKKSSIGGSDLDDVFDSGNMLLLMGGSYDKQPFASVPRQFGQIKAKDKYNRGLIKYRDNFCQIVVPCGELKETEEEEDYRSIF